MTSELFEKGLAARKAVLGEEYVERNLAAADDFNREFQEMVTEFCWGFGWGDEALTFRERSMINLGMIAALGRMEEWELHFRGAIKNGLTREELLLYLGMTLIVMFLASVGLYYCERDAQPDVFGSVFDAMWWAVVTLTTVGYGDAYPITAVGKILTFVVLLLGLGVVAVPSAILASALTKAREEEAEEEAADA